MTFLSASHFASNHAFSPLLQVGGRPQTAAPVFPFSHCGCDCGCVLKSNRRSFCKSPIFPAYLSPIFPSVFPAYIFQQVWVNVVTCSIAAARYVSIKIVYTFSPFAQKSLLQEIYIFFLRSKIPVAAAPYTSLKISSSSETLITL